MMNPQEFINAEFKKRRDRNPNFSLRSFAKWLGISPAQLSQMMAGKRPITLASLKKISDRVGLSPVEKTALMNGLLKENDFIESEEHRKTLHLQEDQFRIISDWYHLAILTLTRIKDAKADPRWIAQRLGISLEQAHEALLRLERLGLVELKPQFKQVSEPLDVVSDVPSDAIRKYHRQNLSLASEKLETVPVPLRQFQSISLPFNPKKIEAFRDLIDDFLENALKLAKSESATEVYHLNVQLIPMTKMS